jgi:hypothetical protein
MMPKNKGTTNQSASGSNKPLPPYHATQSFLKVNVRRGATRQELVQAVDAALRANDVPFFKDNTDPGHTTAGHDATPPAPAQAAYAATAKDQSDTLAPKDALLMLVQQEGW